MTSGWGDCQRKGQHVFLIFYSVAHLRIFQASTPPVLTIIGNYSSISFTPDPHSLPGHVCTYQNVP